MAPVQKCLNQQFLLELDMAWMKNKLVSMAKPMSLDFCVNKQKITMFNNYVTMNQQFYFIVARFCLHV